MNRLYRSLVDRLNDKLQLKWQSSFEMTGELSEKIYIIPPSRTRYLSEISESIRSYNKWVADQAEIAQRLYGIRKSLEALDVSELKEKSPIRLALDELYKQTELSLDGRNRQALEAWPDKVKRFHEEYFTYSVRGKEVKVKT